MAARSGCFGKTPRNPWASLIQARRSTAPCRLRSPSSLRRPGSAGRPTRTVPRPRRRAVRVHGPDLRRRRVDDRVELPSRMQRVDPALLAVHARPLRQVHVPLVEARPADHLPRLDTRAEPYRGLDVPVGEVPDVEAPRVARLGLGVPRPVHVAALDRVHAVGRALRREQRRMRVVHGDVDAEVVPPGPRIVEAAVQDVRPVQRRRRPAVVVVVVVEDEARGSAPGIACTGETRGGNRSAPPARRAPSARGASA